MQFTLGLTAAAAFMLLALTLFLATVSGRSYAVRGAGPFSWSIPLMVATACGLGAMLLSGLAASLYDHGLVAHPMSLQDGGVYHQVEFPDRIWLQLEVDNAPPRVFDLSSISGEVPERFIVRRTEDSEVELVPYGTSAPQENIPTALVGR